MGQERGLGKVWAWKLDPKRTGPPKQTKSPQKLGLGDEHGSGLTEACLQTTKSHEKDQKREHGSVLEESRWPNNSS